MARSSWFRHRYRRLTWSPACRAGWRRRSAGTTPGVPGQSRCGCGWRCTRERCTATRMALPALRLIMRSALAEAPALRSALAASPGVLVVIVSDWLFSEVVRHDPAAEPGSYRKVQVAVKETAAVGWIRTPDPGMIHGDASQDGVLPLRDGAATSLRHSQRLATEGLLHGDAVMDLRGPGLITADGTASLRRPVPAQLPHDAAGFTGRDLALAALESFAAGQETAAAVISAIDGVAGVGKTALAVHFAHHVAAGFPDGQLFVNLRGFDPDQPPLAPDDVLAGFVRALGADSSQAPARPG